MTPTSNDNNVLGGSEEPIAPPAAEVPPTDAATATAEGSAQEAPRKRGGGPRMAGRSASAGNSTKHSMRAEELFPIELQARIQQFRADLTTRYQPADGIEHGFVGVMARAMGKIEHGEELEILDRIRAMERAGTHWDEMRHAAVKDLASRLARDPERVSALLTRSWHGAEWLVLNWLRLADSLKSNGALDLAQHREVHDLLGIPVVHRNGCTEVPPATDAAGLSELVQGQIDWLRERQAGTLAVSDEADQKLARIGWVQQLDKDSRLNLRYLREARSALKTAEARLLAAQAQRTAGPVPPACSASPARRAAAQAAATRPPEPPPEPPPPPPAPPLEPEFVFDVDAELARAVANLHGTPPIEPASAIRWMELPLQERSAILAEFRQMGDAPFQALLARILPELTKVRRIE